VAAEAFTRLVRVEGTMRANREAGHRYAAYAAAMIEHLNRREEIDAALAGNLGYLWFHEAKYDRALAEYQRALALRRATAGPDDPGVAVTLSLIGHVNVSLGRLDEALQHFEEARRVNVTALGPAHPKVGVSLDETGMVLRRLGKASEARDRHQRALALLEAALGPDHTLVATTGRRWRSGKPRTARGTRGWPPSCSTSARATRTWATTRSRSGTTGARSASGTSCWTGTTTSAPSG
jgi:tetratricopeptide (TPR) repeat protein